jgi:hypothetical protein
LTDRGSSLCVRRDHWNTASLQIWVRFGSGKPFQRTPKRIKNGLSVPLESNKLHVVVALSRQRSRVRVPSSRHSSSELPGVTPETSTHGSIHNLCVRKGLNLTPMVDRVGAGWTVVRNTSRRAPRPRSNASEPMSLTCSISTASIQMCQSKTLLAP